MKHLLIILISILLLTSPLFGQSERPETIIIPVSSMGDVSDIRKQILQNTLEGELKGYFRLVPQEKYEQVLEQVFQELEYEECSEDTCIMMVQEMLQVENVFNVQVLGEDKDTQLNLTWRTLVEKKNEEDYCEGCGTGELRKIIGGLVEKLVGVKDLVKEPLISEKEIIKSCNENLVVDGHNYIVFPKDGGKPYGYDVEIILSTTNKLKLKLIYEEDKFNNCLNKMRKGEIDIIWGIGEKDKIERSKYMIMNPYFKWGSGGSSYFAISKKSKFASKVHQFVDTKLTYGEYHQIYNTEYTSSDDHYWYGW